ncbi:MAG: ACT domain-containing protein [Flavonifractor plautii]
MPDGYATISIVLEVKNQEELTNVINKLGQIQGVYQVKRASGRSRGINALDTSLRAGENAGDLARYPRFRALWRGSGCLSGKHPQGVRRIRRAAKPPTATQ